MPALLRKLGDLLKPSEQGLQPVFLVLAEGPMTVTLRPNPRAKRLVLRMARSGAGAVLTVPPRIARRRIIEFLEHSKDWLERQVASRNTRPALVPGASIQFAGEPHELVHAGAGRGVVRRDAETRTIHVPGDPAHFERRLKDWLKQQAKLRLTEASRRYATAMQTSIGRISVRDQKSRWGSCSATGDLSYSWRLIMAPSFVLEYVAAHEVAHRHHMNHGPRFWRLLMQHNADVRAAKLWFRQYGASLHHVVG